MRDSQRERGVESASLLGIAGSLEEGTFKGGEHLVGAVFGSRGIPGSTEGRGELWRGGDPYRDGASAFFTLRVGTIGKVDREVVAEVPRARRTRREVSVVVRNGDRGGEERVVGERRGEKNPVQSGRARVGGARVRCDMVVSVGVVWGVVEVKLSFEGLQLFSEA